MIVHDKVKRDIVLGGLLVVTYHGCFFMESVAQNKINQLHIDMWGQLIGNGPNTVSGSTVSNTELSEFFGAHWVSGSELIEFLSAYDLCVNANSASLSQNSASLPQNSVSSLLRNSTLETVFRPFPSWQGKRLHSTTRWKMSFRDVEFKVKWLKTPPPPPLELFQEAFLGPVKTYRRVQLDYKYS